MKLRSTMLAFFLALMSFSVMGWGQGNLGGLTGTITDPSGGVIPGATITMLNLDTGVSSSVGSSSDGLYWIGNLPPGRYRLTVSQAGFKKYLQEPIVIGTAIVASNNIKLELGTPTQTVTVSAHAMGLETNTAEVGTEFTDRSSDDLPISLGGLATVGASGRRQIANFVYDTPGVTGFQYETHVNGTGGYSFEVLIDGIDDQNIEQPGFINDTSPPFEAVTDFKMQNSNTDAEYGKGFGVMNFTMKSGTNQYHGDLFEFVRNDKLNAAGFNNAAPKALMRQNEFGGTFGGPLRLPHYNGKDKTFFFVAVSGFYLRGYTATAGYSSLPSMQERAGDFRDYPQPIYDPNTTAADGNGGFTRQQINCNGVTGVVCANEFSQVIVRAMQYLPQPDLPGYRLNYRTRGTSPYNDWAESIKIDHVLNARNHLSGTFWWARVTGHQQGDPYGILGYQSHLAESRGGGLRINDAMTLSPNTLNHIGFGYVPDSPQLCYTPVSSGNGNTLLKIPGLPSNGQGMPAFLNAWYSNSGNTPFQGTDPCNTHNWSIVDDVTMIRGRHTIKFGGDFRRRRFLIWDQTNSNGTFSFSALNTSLPDDSAHYSVYGSTFASALLGQVASESENFGNPERTFYDAMFSLYAMDTIKITRKATLNLGLRYELPDYIKEQTGITTFLDPNAKNTGAGGLLGALTFAGKGPNRNGSNNIFGSYHLAFAPSGSLAYAVNDKTVVRMGYSIDRLFPDYGRIYGCSAWCAGFGVSESYTSPDNQVHPAFLLDSGPPVPPSVPDLDPNFSNGGRAYWINPSANHAGIRQGWTVSVQRHLPDNVLLDVAYVGSNTSGSYVGLENPNQLPYSDLSLGNLLNQSITSQAAIQAGYKLPYPGFTGTVAQSLRRFPQYTTLNDVYQPTGFATYNALQVRAQKKFAQGLEFNVSFTYSKTLGAQGTDNYGDTAGGGGGRGVDTNRHYLEKTISDFQIPRILIGTLVYELPVGKGKHFVRNANKYLNPVVGGWQFSGITTYETGSAVAVGGGTNLGLFANTGNRPNVIAGVPQKTAAANNLGSFITSTNNNLFLNPAAFNLPAAFTLGTAPPYLGVTGPALYDEDISLFKKFYLGHESRFLEFRCETFNLFNRVQLGGLQTTVGSSTFGQLTGQSNSGRIIQLAGKLYF